MRSRIGFGIALAMASLALAASFCGAAAALTFTKLTNEMTSKRWYPAAVSLPGGKVLVAGGAAGGEGALKSAELFDPTTNSFSPLANQMTVNREAPGAALLPNGKVLIVGGFGSVGGGEEFYLDSAELYDPSSGKFEAISAKMTTTRFGPLTTLLPNGKVLIAGGAFEKEKEKPKGPPIEVEWHNSAELYDPATNTFTAISPTMVVNEYSGWGGTLPNGKVLIAGGYNGTLRAIQAAELFDPVAEKFTALGAGHTPLEPRSEATQAVLANGDVIGIGGENDHLAKNSTLASLEEFNWESETFAAAGTLTEPRYAPGAAVLPDGRVLVVGGYNEADKAGPYLKSAEVSAVTPAAVTTGPASAITTAGATLAGSASSEASLTGSFQYGVTAAYGSSTAKQTVVASNKAIAFSAAIAGLAPGTTYHFRAVGENLGGVVYGTDQTFTTASVPPTISKLSQSHARWRSGAKLAQIAKRAPLGTTFTLTLDQPATLTLAFTQPASGRKVKGHCIAQTHANRHKPSCRRTLTRGTLTLAAHAGTNAITFQGRLSSSRKLRPGTYTLVLSAVNAAKQSSAAKRLTFTIVR